MSQKEINYAEFFENIDCNISSDSKFIDINSFPTIKVLLRYIGNNPVKINWDKNFGYLLWEGKFVLLSKSDRSTYDTSKLKFKTSNTYPPRKTVELNKSDVLTSILDFSQLPVSYEREQLIHEKKFSLVLCVGSIDEKQALRTISNEIVFNEK